MSKRMTLPHPSKVYEEALDLFQEGKSWAQNIEEIPDKVCVVTSILTVAGKYNLPGTAAELLTRNLARVLGFKRSADLVSWNDKAKDFSTIKEGFNKAIKESNKVA
jgi:hypothetical protein